MKRTRENSSYYIWGDQCEAWTLLHSVNGIVKEEQMPSDRQEQLHFHDETEQFFYVLDGQATFVLDGERITLSKNQGLHVPAKKPHKICNDSKQDLRFLVISFPGHAKDRVNLP